MIKVYYGENRVKAQEEIRKFLGAKYEVIDGAELSKEDLPNIFWGNSLFGGERAVLVRDILTNKEVAGELPMYLKTPHKVVLWEMKIDKRASAYKAMQGKVEFKEFVMPREKNAGVEFDIYRTAKRDGEKAVEQLAKIKDNKEPMLFLGLMVSQAVRDYSVHPGIKEKRALRELSKLDMQLKLESKLQPWTLIETFLLRLSSL